MDVSTNVEATRTEKRRRAPDAVDLLPARMVNEHVYCPRLFYFEHVEKIFVHNADTLAGKTAHERVDAEEKDLDPEAEEPERLHTRSVSLFSDHLGITAKLDLVESKADEDGAAAYRPIEYKKGRPRETDDGKEIWPADKVQLALQILLLRENGFNCPEGLVYYRETRQQITLPYSSELEEWTGAQINAARATARMDERPPPLDDSPKCPRCSLVSVCLPDETRLLREFSAHRKTPQAEQMDLEFEDEAPSGNNDSRLEANPFADFPEIRTPPLKADKDIRRLIAPDVDNRALYVHTPGAFVGKKDETIVIKEKKKKVADFRLIDVHHIAVFGPVSLSTPLVQTCCERDIPISYFSMGGWFYGMTRGHGLKNVFTRIEQFRWAADPVSKLELARCFVHGKIRNQRTLLLRNHREAPKSTLKALKKLSGMALYQNSLPSLLGIEGAAARYYFEAFDGMIKREEEREEMEEGKDVFGFSFDGRNRRPPRDPVNALLSLAYALLSKDCSIAAWSAGFDPYVGFLHEARFGRPALALDIMEEFRPIIADSVVVRMLNNRMVDQSDFVVTGQGVGLTTKGRKALFMAYEKRLHDPIMHPVFGYRISYRRALELQFRLLAKVLTGEIEQYIPFTTR